VVNACITCAASPPVTSTSRSPIVSFRRRNEPASSTWSTPFTVRMRSAIACAIGHASPRSMRPDHCDALASAFSTFCSTFSPKPGSSRSWPFFAASSSAARVRMWSVSNSVFTRLGPRPCSSVKLTTSSGYFFSSASMACVWPEATSSRIASAMLLPMPSIASSAPGSFTIDASASPWFSTTRAPSL